jgi:hypothetical protein
MDINEKVLLLAILKKESVETLNDVVLKLENTGLFSLKEGKTYTFKMVRNNLEDIRWYGQVFCTDQIDSSQGFADVEGYTINEGRYTTNESINEFIVL